MCSSDLRALGHAGRVGSRQEVSYSCNEQVIGRVGSPGSFCPYRARRRCHLRVLRKGARDVARALRRRPHRAALRRPEDQHQSQSRSEEHTSELQSLMRISYAVFCLKKKKKNKINKINSTKK